MSKNNKSENADRIIAVNRRARHDYFIEENYEAGLSLQGWEVKSLRAGRAQIAEAYVIVKNEEAFLIGAHITPLKQTCTHEVADATRTRKLLMHQRELSTLIGKVERAGYTLVPLDLHWADRGLAKLQVGLAKGKKQHDKRESLKEKDWLRQKERIMRHAG